MKYTQASLGRVFLARFEAEEDLLAELKTLIKRENISSGIIYLLGALTNTDVVLGPERKEYPPSPVRRNFSDVREMLGIGIFAFEGDEPKIHLHAGFGNKKEALVGCVRNRAEVYLTIECVIHEFKDADITRKPDERYNASLLNF